MLTRSPLQTQNHAKLKGLSKSKLKMSNLKSKVKM